ncbi:ABC transporter ATP-binding protein [Geminocystis sp. NIES-3709]|uniref:ABC transporter ATP-binding protein n=1 Tax=Geminocystis sp. NIES-3709 TaxID=1617448 RepID=UPI0005FC5C3B|nr:ABC transporter ATP-binding protein [Geminocystis sp. NIES-3709]BAQ66184.1 teichoic acid export ATP-binding protein TagH [Geminocystis sp. NIES-3709]
MSDIIIKVENLGKKYTIAHEKQERYVALRDVIANSAKSFTEKLFQSKKESFNNPEKEEFWALKDVSFEIKRGDRVGIIGRNGAGKSTLLKVLSRITEPTTGKISIKGRVASLLEVGTGFHPELTGRENIFLNGAILGMSRVEIKKKFDEIVAFAEVEKFLDTPVKRYSSGMYVRLAFAVAAHLEPEILIVDEVLAVGDAQFQKKCLGKMEDVAKNEGRTVLFVTHNMAAIHVLCNNGIFMNNGTPQFIGKVDKCLDEYFSSIESFNQEHTIKPLKPEKSPMWIESVTLLCNNKPNTKFLTGDLISLKLSYCSENLIREPKVGLIIYTSDGNPLLNANNHYQLPKNSLINPVNEGVLECNLGKVPLMEGKYFISLWLGDSIMDYQYIEHILSFDVVNQDVWGSGKVPQNLSPLWWPVEFYFT